MKSIFLHLEALRLVEIEGVDCSPLLFSLLWPSFLRSTSDICGLIKILKAVKHKQGVRIWFVCGYRAYQDYHQKASSSDANFSKTFFTT